MKKISEFLSALLRSYKRHTSNANIQKLTILDKFQVTFAYKKLY